MFTGIISDVAFIKSLKKGKGDLGLTIQTKLPLDNVSIGDSVSCSGICLTVVNKSSAQIEVEISKETLSVSTSKYWDISSKLNLELSSVLGSSMGGHIVTGHVDGIAILLERKNIAGSIKMTFSIPTGLKKYIAKKGSIAVDGISLTVNEVYSASFEVNIISHTSDSTTLSSIEMGNKVNIEIDIIARYAINAIQNYVKSE